jgi:hypothetical protein
MSKTDIMVAHNRSIIAKILAKETLKLLTDPKRLLSDETPLDNKTAILFVGEVICLVLTSILNDKPLKYEGEDLYNHVHKNYTEAKSDVAEVIGKAFTKAVHDFSGKDLQYMCEIGPMPERNKNKDN